MDAGCLGMSSDVDAFIMGRGAYATTGVMKLRSKCHKQ